MSSMEKLLEVECQKLLDFLPKPEEIEAINLIITEPESLIDEDLEVKDVDLGIEGMPDDTFPEMDVARDEDYYQVREEGLLENLIYQIMRHECRENSDGLWLTSVLMSRIAKNQIFGEGNKRTAYLVGVLFLRHLQDVNGFDGALIPELNEELTRLLSDIAIENEDHVDETNLHETRNLERDAKQLYEYLKEGMDDFIEEQLDEN